MKFELPKYIDNLLSKFEKAGFEICIVGGAVRDLLTGREVTDWDFTTNATPKQIQKILPDSFYENKFGTVGLKIDNLERPLEITTYRTEHGYSDARRPDKVRWGKTVEEDLKRRDFTINAMAVKRIQGKLEIVDLFEGVADLKKKLIRAVGKADERFREDALRMMRAVRFAAQLSYKIEPKTLAAIKKDAKLIHKIAAERIKDELFKLLSAPHPEKGVESLREAGLLKEILPELAICFGVEQKSPNRHHIYDVGTHAVLSLKHVAERNLDPVVRFATLIHDIGKADTRKVLDSGVVTFYNHEVAGARIAKMIARRLRFSKKETDKLWILVRRHQFTVNEHQSDKAIRRFIRKVGVENVEDILDLRTGDRLGSGARETSWRTEEFKKRLVEVQKQPFSIHDLKIKGNDVMKELNLKPGPEIGRILNELFKKVEEKEIPNTRQGLLSELKGSPDREK